jgi:hypothetical protein
LRLLKCRAGAGIAKKYIFFDIYLLTPAQPAAKWSPSI